MKKLLKKLSPLFALVVMIVAGFSLVGCDRKDDLTSREQAIYQLVLDASYKFKNPSSVRIVSGMVTFDEANAENSDKEFSNFELQRGYAIDGHFRFTATNSFGATISEYYFCGYNDDGTIFAYSFDTYKNLVPTIYAKMVEWASKTDDFDIDKINAELEKKWNP